MDYLIQGKIHDDLNNPVVDIPIKAFDSDPLFDDDFLGESHSDQNGNFIIKFNTTQFDWSRTEGKPEIYLTINDLYSTFESVTDRQGVYTRKDDDVGNTIWISDLIDNVSQVNKYDLTVRLTPISIPKECDTVVIGTGFGGTILSLSLAEMFKDNDASKPDSKKRRICMLERGQWWMSHEVPDSPEGRSSPKKTLREYLNEKNMPYAFWAYPDNLQGAFKILGSATPINRKGSYDYRILGNVHVIASNGVGGGSLVYNNITEKPNHSVYADWECEHDAYPKRIGDFFNRVEEFIGVNKISTTAGLGGYKLPRAKVFQEAAKAINKNALDNNQVPPIINLNSLDAKLSITDVPAGLFNTKLPPNNRPTPEEIQKYSKENSVCQRQGRCVLGCIPGSRHTLSKQIFAALTDRGLPIDVIPLCQVNFISKIQDPNYQYEIHYKSFRDNKNGRTGTIKAKSVILAAGSLGSTEILMRSQKNGNFTLSDTLGTKFSTNGDLLGVVNPTRENVDASRGPITTSVAAFQDTNKKFTHTIEDSGIPKMFSEIFSTMFNYLMGSKQFAFLNPVGLFSSLVLNNRKLMSRLESMLNGQGLTSSDVLELTISKMTTLLKDRDRPNASPEERVENILMLSCMGVDKANAKLKLENDRIQLDGDYDLDQPVFGEIIKTLEKFAEIIGKKGKNSLLVPLWNDDPKKRTQFVLHPLGGCPMGNNAEKGVVNGVGEVFMGKSGNKTYPDLYIVDGSIIPSSLGVNPSLTISALAYRIASKIVVDDKYLP
jgi:choline dehydrogenase-like flavoprotein